MNIFGCSVARSRTCRAQTGDYVRVHFLDAIEAPLFLREGRYLAGVVVSPSAAHDSALVEVVGLAGPERFFVPNTRMEFVTAKGSSLVVEAFESERNQASGVRHYCEMHVFCVWGEVGVHGNGHGSACDMMMVMLATHVRWTAMTRTGLTTTSQVRAIESLPWEFQRIS